MSSEIIFSFLRQALMFGGGYLVTTGWFDSGTLTTVVGAVMTLVSSAWSVYNAHQVALSKTP